MHLQWVPRGVKQNGIDAVADGIAAADDVAAVVAAAAVLVLHEIRPTPAAAVADATMPLPQPADV